METTSTDLRASIEAINPALLCTTEDVVFEQIDEVHELLATLKKR